MTKWLSVIPESKINCSTQKIVDQLKNVKLDPEEAMISFDVSSLYTNVPVNEAINANLLYSGRYETPPVDKETFIALTKLAVIDVVLLPFLDMCIIHINNELHSKWYQKPSDTGLVMNFHALAPKKYKRSVIQGLVYRIYRASSHWCYVHEGLTKAKEILERNQYPPQCYDSIFKETLEKIIVGKENVNGNMESEDTPEKPSKVSVFLQYRGQQTDLFVKRLRDSGAPLQSILTMRKLKTVLPSLKSSTKEILRSRVV